MKAVVAKNASMADAVFDGQRACLVVRGCADLEQRKASGFGLGSKLNKNKGCG